MNKYIVKRNTSLMEVMNKINDNCKGIVYVCEQNKLVGVITDGNVRRHILNGGSLDAKAIEVANLEPKYILNTQNYDYYEILKREKITSIPIVNLNKEIISIKFIDDQSIYKKTNLNLPVVIMAGGKGTRLKPYTDILPKPLIPVAGKTIIERIMDRFECFGCNKFDCIVNYKGELIKAYFNDVSNDITFFDEEDFRGTAGGLTLIDGRYNSTFFVTNCDVILDDDYSEILRYHKKKKAIITMVCALKEYEMPYGTVSLSKTGNVNEIIEKPSLSFLVNTGMYLVEPRFLNYIPDGEFIHMTDVIERCIDNKEIVGMYPVGSNAWLDMGELNELENMRDFYERKENISERKDSSLR